MFSIMVPMLPTMEDTTRTPGVTLGGKNFSQNFVITYEKINSDEDVLGILNRLRSFSEGGHSEHGPVETGILCYMDIEDSRSFIMHQTGMITHLARY